MPLGTSNFPLPARTPVCLVHGPVVAGHGFALVQRPFCDSRRRGMNIGAGKSQQANEKQSNTQHKKELGDNCNWLIKPAVATRYSVINLNHGIIIINSESFFISYRTPPSNNYCFIIDNKILT
ncbi:MAG TPA: hypothetical protein VF629_13655 [Hymenobacter sp.]|uniref:hypothetical protein n=1 Tax=Hymenobacter sp. TaxID=1898978 RepID=UPI002ED82BBE